jgi:hypothetical protein
LPKTLPLKSYFELIADPDFARTSRLSIIREQAFAQEIAVLAPPKRRIKQRDSSRVFVG